MKRLAVVYLGGTGGQFVRNILTGIITETYPDLQFSKYGSAHLVHLNQAQSCEWSRPKINTNTESTQSHSFISIPELVTTYGKVVAITIKPNCFEEFIIRTINVLMKLNLEEQPVDVITTQLKIDLTRHLGPKYKQLAIDVYNTRYDPEFKEICLYFLFKNMFSDKNQYLFEMEKAWYGEGNIDGCIELPFNIIRSGDTVAFINVVEKVIGTQLTDTQLRYTETIFNRYYDLQDKLLYNDPYEFMRITKQIGLEKLEALRQRYDRYGIY